MESAERIARVFRADYRLVEFIVPGYAMSAGSILVMSGDAIHMDYASILGPIDPQIRQPGSDRFVPALGCLKQFQRFIDKSATDEARHDRRDGEPALVPRCGAQPTGTQPRSRNGASGC
jgi:ClpP class serine protease